LLFYSLLFFDKNISTLIALLFLILLRYHYSNMSMNFFQCSVSSVQLAVKNCFL